MQVKYGCDDSIQEGCSSSRVIGDAHNDGFILYSKELSTSAGEMSIMRMNMIKIRRIRMKSVWMEIERWNLTKIILVFWGADAQNRCNLLSKKVTN